MIIYLGCCLNESEYGHDDDYYDIGEDLNDFDEVYDDDEAFSQLQ